MFSCAHVTRSFVVESFEELIRRGGAKALHENEEFSRARVTCPFVVESFEERMRRGGARALHEAGRFLMGDDAVHRSLHKLAREFDALGVPYAVAGGMALVAHGYERTTVDVDVLVSADGLRRVHAALDGRGYLPPFEGSRDLRDVETGVRIEFLVAGQFPGDGLPKAIAFPDPAQVAVEIAGIRFLELRTLVELKLASGLSAPGRLKDLADVQELIRELRLERAFAERLDPSVRAKFAELWGAVAADPPRS